MLLTKSDLLVVSNSALGLFRLDILSIEEYVVLLLESLIVLYNIIRSLPFPLKLHRTPINPNYPTSPGLSQWPDGAWMSRRTWINSDIFVFDLSYLII